MQGERNFGEADIDHIVVHGSKVTMDHVGWKYEPQGLTSAQLNLPYCVATWLLEGDVFVDQFTDDMVADPERMRVAGKVSVAEDPAITALGSKSRHKVHVEVFLKDGTKIEKTVEAGRGNERDFASEADIVEKFEKLATHVLPLPQVQKIRDFMLTLEQQSDAGDLARLLAKA
jgi:2-methylcitrate dehydratase PrpD